MFIVSKEGFVAILFVAAFLVLTLLSRSLLKTVDLTSSAINNEKNLYQTTGHSSETLENDEKEQEKNVFQVKGSDIIITMREGLDVDVMINNNLISKESYGYTIDTSLVNPYATYTYEYIYSSSGEVVRIEYRSI